MNCESITQMLNRLAAPLNELNWKGQIIAAFDDLTAHNLALVEENGKLKEDRDNWRQASELNKTVADVQTNELSELIEKVKEVEAKATTFARIANHNVEVSKRASQRAAELEATIKYLHKALDAQQKQLDKLRQGDLCQRTVIDHIDAAGKTVTRQSSRYRARQILNELKQSQIQSYTGHREAQLIDALLLILDEIPKEVRPQNANRNQTIRT